MGSNSNRRETESERIGRFAKEISSCRDISSGEFQSHTAAEIRGRMGTEKGNKFIQAIKEANG